MEGYPWLTEHLLTDNRNNIISKELLPFGLSADTIRTILDNPYQILDNEFQDDESGAIRGALIESYKLGFRIVFILGAGLAALAFVQAWFLLPQVELNRPDDEKLKEEAKGARR